MIVLPGDRNRSKLFLIVLCALLAFLPPVQAQSSPADSIRKHLAALDKNDPDYLRDKAGSLGTLLQVVKYSDPAEALLLSDQLAEVFFLLGDSVKAYEALYRYKAGIYELKGEADKMLMNLEAYAEALSRIGKSDGYVYVDIGNVYFSFGMFDIARGTYSHAETIFRENGNIQGLCTIYNNYAQIQMARNRNDSALTWLRRSYELRKTKLNDRFLADEARYLMARAFRDEGRYDSAKAFLRVILADFDDPAFAKHTDHIALRQEFSGSYTAMGIIYTLEKTWDSAAFYFSRAEEVYNKYDYDHRMPVLYASWARLYMAMNRSDSAMLYIRKVEQHSDVRNPEDAMNLHALYADYFELTGNMEEAYRNRMLYYRIDDSLQASGYNEQMVIAGARVMQLQNQARIDGQKMELAQKDLQAQQHARERNSLFIIAGALFLLVLLAIISVYQLRQKNKIIGVYNRELQAANETKEQFLSVISHDLRGPFNTLIGMSNVLITNVREKNYGQVSDNAELINESSRKAYVLLDNLMQWVSLQKESIEVRKENVPMNELADEVLLLFRGQALAHSTTIAKNIRVTHAYTDKNLLQVILRNLLSNAIRHIPVGGRVQLTIDSLVKDVRLVVEDNGKGFTEQELENLFLHKEGTSIARKGGGLGLLLVGQFVRQLDGTITAENAPGGGARFTIILYGAMLAGSAEPGEARAPEQPPVLTEQDKTALSALLAGLRGYEIFDTSEIRTLLGKDTAGDSAAVAEWRRQVLQAVYLVDEARFRMLVESASV